MPFSMISLSNTTRAEDGTAGENGLEDDDSRWGTRNGVELDTDEDVERLPEDTSMAAATGESILTSYLGGSNNPMFVVDREGVYTYTNAAFRRLFDCEPGDLLGTNIFDYDESDDEELREALETGAPTHADQEEIELPTETLYLERTTLPLYDAQGSVTGALVIIRDVSERVRSQQRERQLEAYQSTVIDEFQGWLARLSEGDYTVEPSVPEPEAEFDRIQAVHERFET
ncbi:MAG: methyl-accepting chemotaxis protein, partial [Halobacteriales archaeon]